MRSPSLVSRRAALLGCGAAALGACSGGDTGRRPASPTPSASSTGPVINQQRLGNVITPEDLADMEQRLNDALAGNDWETFRTYLHRYDPHQRWQRTLQGFQDVPMTLRRFYIATNEARMNNSSGGAVEASITLALAHQIRGCDAQPLAEPVTATIRKQDETSPVAPVEMAAPGYADGAPLWEYGAVAVVESPHVLLMAREQDAGLARGALPAIERGVARSMAYLPPASGVEKLCITLGWPAARRRLFGGYEGDFFGVAHSMEFVDPQELANLGERPEGGQPFAGSRIVLEQQALSSPAVTESVAAHEAIHALALKWGDGASPTYAEGYAEWFQNGRAAGVSRSAEEFEAFRARHRADSFAERFYDPAHVEGNYLGASLIYAWAEATRGPDAPARLAEAAYGGGIAEPARKAFGISDAEMFRQVAAWV